MSGSGGHFEFDRQINRQSLFYTVVGESLFYTVVGDKCFFYTVVGDSLYFIQLWVTESLFYTVVGDSLYLIQLWVTVFILYSCGWQSVLNLNSFQVLDIIFLNIYTIHSISHPSSNYIKLFIFLTLYQMGARWLHWLYL